MQSHLESELEQITAAGLFKSERVIAGAQDVEITLTDGSKVLNFCANNYLGLSSDPRVCEAAKRAIDTHGFGMSSVRFICGTQDIHKELEAKIAEFHHTEDTILYAAAFDANGGVFEPLLGPDDAIISDALNHASIIDGVRLCKAARYRYANDDMADLEAQLQKAQAANHRFKVIVTDGVFSMDGYVAQIDKICDLAEQYDALVMVDECHATGFIGKQGAGALNCATPWVGSISSPVRWARPWAVPWVGSRRAGRKSSKCCASGRGRTCSRTAWLEHCRCVVGGVQHAE